MFINSEIQQTVRKIIQQVINDINSFEFSKVILWLVKPLKIVESRLENLSVGDLEEFFKEILRKNPIGKNNPNLTVFISDLSIKYKTATKIATIIRIMMMNLNRSPIKFKIFSKNSVGLTSSAKTTR
jgi:hypothetical protein